ncbi:MAG: phosphatase PAP2 family protein [Bacteroidetes bacterium]|nr:phosphatase PAP2 family protein [Bacteroidota bacterium]
MSNGVFDFLMPLFRDKYFWIPLYILLLFLIIRKHKWQSVYVIGFAVLTILLADQISAHMIKPAVQRLRPCNDPMLKDLVHLRAACGSGYSFVSSHAANHFALAFFFISVFARPSNRFYVTLLFIIWAGLISFAQVYVGVHFPIDVLSGAMLGAAIGYGIGWLNLITLCHRCGKVI